MNATMFTVGTAAILLIVAGTVWYWGQQNEEGEESAVVAETRLPTQGIRSVSPAEFAETLAYEQPILLDVRTPQEFADGHLEGAINVDFYAPTFADRLAELDRDQPYAVYCRSGNRTSETLRIMRALGFTQVTELSGGVVAWQQAGKSMCDGATC